MLVLSHAYGKYKSVIAAYITSKIKDKLETDVLVNQSGQSGLTVNSVIRLHKLESIVSSSVRGTLGDLPTEKVAEVKRKLRTLFGL